jgi:hypothetical protein
MNALCTSEPTVSVFDRVSVEGRAGLAVGFYAREERVVVVRLDVGGVIEVPESQVDVVSDRVEIGWPKSMCGLAGRVRAVESFVSA